MTVYAQLEGLDKLVKQSQAGDREAYGKIYQWYRTRIYRFVYYLIGNQQTAEDLTQVTFIRVWKALSYYSRDKGTFASYLFSTARNLVIDWQRKKKDVPLLHAEWIETPDTLIEDLAKKERKQVLTKTLRTLSEADRQIVTLRFFEELSFAEIARIVRKSEVGVRVKLHRVLGHLRSKLKGKL